MFIQKNITRFFLIFLTYFLAITTAYAESLNIYDKPEEKAKIIATIDSDSSIIPIFYNATKDWTKIANPKNGDVGWVKSSELKGPTIITDFNGNIFRQQFISDNKNAPQSYSIIQYSDGNTHKLSPEETNKILTKIKARQKEAIVHMQQMHENMQKIMKNMTKEFDENFVLQTEFPPTIKVTSDTQQHNVSKNSTKNLQQENHLIPEKQAPISDKTTNTKQQISNK